MAMLDECKFNMILEGIWGGIYTSSLRLGNSSKYFLCSP